jgi:hypothetical protein
LSRGGRASLVILSVTGAVLLGACSPSGSGAKPPSERQHSAGTFSSATVSSPRPTPSVAFPRTSGGSQGPLSDATAPKPAPYVAVKPSAGGPPLDFGQPIASMEAVLNNHGRQRVDGEKAARDIAKLLLDSRTRMSGEEVIGLISAPTLPATTREFLINDYDRSRGGNLQRYCDPAAGAYARSSYEGSASLPSRVSFNFACFETSDLMKFGAWYITSYDVVPSLSGGWQLAEAGFSGTPIGWPPNRMNMTAAEKSRLLVGPGWRRLSP